MRASLLLVALVALLAASQARDLELSAGAPAPAPAGGVGAPAPGPAEPLLRAVAGTSGPAGYTLAQVAEHATPADGWLAIKGKVYDVTQWIPKHPGGPIIIEYLGTDATEVFTLYHPPGTDSGEEAGDNLPDYYIGDLLVA